MKTTFKPYRGHTTMQIEAETDNERALLHAVFGDYYQKDLLKHKQKKAFAKVKTKYHPRLRLIREYQNGRVAKICVKTVEYLNPTILFQEKGWKELDYDIIVKRIDDKRFLIGTFKSILVFYDIYFDLSIANLLNPDEPVLDYLFEVYGPEINEFNFKSDLSMLILICKHLFPHENAYAKKYIVHTLEEYGIALKKIDNSKELS